MGNGRSKKKDLGAPKKSFWGRKKKKRDDVDEGKMAEPAGGDGGDDEEWDETQRGAEHFAAHYNYTNTRDLGKVRFPPPPLPLHTHTHTHTHHTHSISLAVPAREKRNAHVYNPYSSVSRLDGRSSFPRAAVGGTAPRARSRTKGELPRETL